MKKKVNLHRVKNLKKQFKGTIDQAEKTLKSVLKNEVSQNKEKYLKSSKKSGEQKQKDSANGKVLSKNKKRKLQHREKDDEKGSAEHKNADEEEEV